MITIARDIFQMVVTERDAASAVLKALSGVSVTVYKRDTVTQVPIYRRHDGTTQGPAVETGATGGPNPFITGVSGQIEFWCDGPAEFDVRIEDTEAPARVAPRTIGWNALVAAPNSIPTSMLAQDASLGLASMGADVVRQMHQIGEVIDWWRPNATVPLPAGFEICAGQVIAWGLHDFAVPAGTNINMPDLRNTFILGADATKAHAAAAGQSNAAADAPGIGGSGGSNAAKNLAHGHGVPGVSHSHYVGVPDHLHHAGGLYAADHAHGIAWATANRGSPNGYSANSANEGVAFTNHAHYGSGIYGSGNIGVGGYTAACDRAMAVYSAGPNVSLNTATNSLTWNADPGSGGVVVDIRPQFYGLLKLMKVRRT